MTGLERLLLVWDGIGTEIDSLRGGFVKGNRVCNNIYDNKDVLLTNTFRDRSIGRESLRH